jgi:hypothetical protein
MRSRVFTTQLGATLYTHIAALRTAVFAMVGNADAVDPDGMANLSLKTFNA